MAFHLPSTKAGGASPQTPGLCVWVKEKPKSIPAIFGDCCLTHTQTSHPLSASYHRKREWSATPTSTVDHDPAVHNDRGKKGTLCLADFEGVLSKKSWRKQPRGLGGKTNEDFSGLGPWAAQGLSFHLSKRLHLAKLAVGDALGQENQHILRVGHPVAHALHRGVLSMSAERPCLSERAVFLCNPLKSAKKRDISVLRNPERHKLVETCHETPPPPRETKRIEQCLCSRVRSRPPVNK